MDVPLEKRNATTFDLDLPLEEQEWAVGLIVGPSGSGKSSIARHLWPQQMADSFAWSERAIVDDFPDGMPISAITGLLMSVGLSSVPAWLRPHHTLSNGEQFRADMARALAERPDLAVIDEFTSVVDRQVAQVASHTIQKAVRSRGSSFVAVSCHYDILDWLQPDWVLDMASGEFHWRSVQPHPPVELAIHPIHRSSWRRFSRHHYLSTAIATGAQCFGAFTPDGQCVAFASYIHFAHPKTKNIKSGHRTVVLPDWQGLGIAGKLADWMGQHLHRQGFRFHRSIAHPALIAHFRRSPRWREIGTRTLYINTTSRNKALRAKTLNPRYFSQRSFAYVPTREPPSVRAPSDADTVNG
jgi:ABC-type dipeptide/oligopeptide/nickel transport system ATPase subunit